MGDADGVTRDRLRLWGGVECTINRVGDVYHSQLERSGLASRIEGMRKFGKLGISTLRFPILWERVKPKENEKANWSWSDRGLAILGELGIEPIAGLLHHGSGPRFTSLVDPAFPAKFEAYASAVAERYPNITKFTPVNEILTTARFSGLYGFWYPHGRDEATFRIALLNQCKATVLGMAAIRRHIPSAQLVQTDDLGKTYSTPLLAYQAKMNNELRWLSWDLLCGRVDTHHYLWDWLTRSCGATAGELMWFVENACTPDLIGVDYYVTSERVIDHRLDRYPSRVHGGNGRHSYADIEAARCLATPTGGIGPLLDEVWSRYKLPIAITEVHIDSTREEQMRWLMEIWQAAQGARKRGVDIRAVTAWALMGSFDWNSLCTRANGYYESSAFDLRGPEPRPTAVARLMSQLAAGSTPKDPALASPGWWKRAGRHHCKPFRLALPKSARRATSRPSGAPPILITGASGGLGRAFARACEHRGLNYHQLTRQEMDIADDVSVDAAYARYQPWAIINAAGYARVDDAEHEMQRCYRENTLGPEVLAALCARHAIPFVTFSTDLVFDGRQRAPYVEDDMVGPLSVYGLSKANAEDAVLERHPAALVIRTSSFFGHIGPHDGIGVALQRLREGRPVHASNDLTVTPTYVPDLVNISLDLLNDREHGIWHLTNGEALTWAEFTLRAAQLASVDHRNLHARPSADLKFTANRPTYSALGSSRSSLMPSLANALGRYLAPVAGNA